MQRIILFVLAFGGGVLWLNAQQLDSTAVGDPAPVETVKSNEPAAPVENPVVVQPVDSVSPSVPAAPSIPAEPTQPRIIYYQDSKPDYENKKSDIKTLSGSVNHSGGFFGFDFRTSQFENQTMVFGGFRTGWIVNRALGIGVEAHGLVPTAKLDGKDTQGSRTALLLGGYGGMFMEFVLFSNQVVHVTFPVAGGAGWLGYHEDWDEDYISIPDPTVPYEKAEPLMDHDVFWYVEPGAALEVNVSRSFRMAFGLSKRLTQDLVLVNTESKEFENLNFFLTLKVGKF